MDGGYMVNSSAGQGDDHDPMNEKSIRHLLVKQATSLSGDAPFYVDGVPLKEFLIVGIVTGVNPRDNRTQITMSDGTGETTITVWNDDDKPLELEQGQYACALVNPRSYSDTVQLTALNVYQPVPFSQVMNHDASALREHLAFTGVKPFAGVNIQTTTKTEQAAESQGEDFGIYGDEEMQKAKLLEQLDTEGVAVEALCRQFKSDASRIRTLLEALEREGRAWNDGGAPGQEQWFVSTDM